MILGSVKIQVVLGFSLYIVLYVVLDYVIGRLVKRLTIAEQ